MNSRLIAAVFAGAVALLGSPASAGDDVRTVLDDAKVLMRKGEWLAAAARFGDAVALAQKNSDLAAEEKAADALSDFVVTRSSDPVAGAEKPPSATAIFAAVLARLDPSHRGAFVSAPVLARNLLLLATETGDLASVPAAAKVAAAHAKSGHGCAAVANYAAGMQALAEKRAADAVGPLRTAFDAAKAAGWTDLASHAGTEMAVAALAAGDAAGATAALRETATVFSEKETRPKSVWLRCLHARLADAPEELRKLGDELAKWGPSSASAAGGRGGAGGAGGSSEKPQSDVARLLAKLPRSKPFVSVTRNAEGLEIHWATAPQKKKLHEIEDGLRHADEGGVTLSFQGPSVALRMVDLEGGRGQPGESSEPDLARAFYLLAPGETWSVLKDGTVTIGGK